MSRNPQSISLDILQGKGKAKGQQLQVWVYNRLPSGSDYRLIMNDYGLITGEITGDYGLIAGDHRLITEDYRLITGVITDVGVQSITGVAVPWEKPFSRVKPLDFSQGARNTLRIEL